uniref:Uncharacterized protein n=1 Tax=Arundo donax TaxID=35708 RepID=A0A0A9GUG7_ARUDO
MTMSYYSFTSSWQRGAWRTTCFEEGQFVSHCLGASG